MAEVRQVQAGWEGHLALCFACRDGTTRLVRQAGRGPLLVQRPFYPEGPGVCHGVLLHPPGGLVGGDRLTLDLTLERNARVLITTPAAGKIYRSTGAEAFYSVEAKVAAGACLEWLPQEGIVFDGAHCFQSMRVDLAPGARWLGWDIVRFGRTARGERFQGGRWRNRFEVWRGNSPLWIDRQRLEGGHLLDSPFGLAGQAVVGTLLWLGQAVEPSMAARARDAWYALGGAGETGVTRLPDGLLCRYRGSSSQEARRWFMHVWRVLRTSYFRQSASIPRIWNT